MDAIYWARRVEAALKDADRLRDALVGIAVWSVSYEDAVRRAQNALRPPPSEHQSGASPNTGGQPKAGGQRMHNALHAIAHNLIGYAVRPGESREGANLAAMQRIALEALDETQHKNRECLGVMDDPEHATGEKI
jgi:hypothetical protein